MNEHRHLSDEDLLESVLEGRGAPAAGQPDCAECDRRRVDLSAFLSSCRTQLLADDEDATVRRSGATGEPDDLAARILAQTTGAPRSRPGLVGDLRLVVDFARDRLGHSRVLRIAAASLLAHLVALPVLAWYAYRNDPPPEPHIGFVLPTAQPAEWSGATEPEREVDVPSPGDDPEVRVVPVPLGGALDPSRLETLLDAIEGEVPPEFVPAPLPTAPLLERILWGEVLLNRQRVPGPAAEEARASWLALATDLAASSPAEPDTRACLALLWARAEGMALLPAPARQSLERLRAHPEAAEWIMLQEGRRSPEARDRWRSLVRGAWRGDSNGKLGGR
jgi:hypothetical protein